MKKTIVNVLGVASLATALLIGCASTQSQAEVSPGAVDGSKSAPACSASGSCSSTTCPAAKAKQTDDAASPGAVGDCTPAKSGCCPSKCAEPQQCPSTGAKESACPGQTTVSPGALSDGPCCPPCKA